MGPRGTAFRPAPRGTWAIPPADGAWPLVLPLGAADAARPPLVGGKAAALSRLAADFPVPPGFCVTTAAHALAPGPLPPAVVVRAVAEAYANLAARCGTADPAVAVRSSAVDEDGADASFAGQHETYLNVKGIDAVLDAVARCWASGSTERALCYRRRHGLDGAPHLAVLVQRLVAADSSGVAFTLDPVGGDSSAVWINAAWGLGESVVGGTVTPDVYVVRKADLRVTWRQIAEKGRMTVPVAAGTAEVDVPRFLRGEPTLTDEGAAAIARLAVELERRMGWPVDVECAFADGTLHVLQCRPVTTRGHAEGADRGPEPRR